MFAALLRLSNSSISREFTPDDIVVTIEWTGKSIVSYDASVIPHIDVAMTASTSVQITIPYNVLHIVSITASLCGHSSTKVYRLNYSKLLLYDLFVLLKSKWDKHAAQCDYPIPQLTNDAVAEVIFGSQDPALVGTTVMFTCTSGLHDMVLIGPSNSSCKDNGEWEPDPRQVECKGIIDLQIYDYLLCKYPLTCSEL